ncbi:MAG: Cell cycle serine/threonine-protein kinase cdc5/MSD2, partial [Paramarteilia canceri]
NILCTYDLSIIKLCDFGLASLECSEGCNSQPKGTPRFMAPEILNLETRKESWHTEVYSLGVLWQQILFGSAFDKNIGESIFCLIDEMKNSHCNESLCSLSCDDLRNDLDLLCSSMVDPKPQNRPTLLNIIESEFFTEKKVYLMENHNKRYEILF